MAITVKGEILVPARDDEAYEMRSQHYTSHDGVERAEIKSVSGESDFISGTWMRHSSDNGQSWGSWEDKYEKSFQMLGSDEMAVYEPAAEVWNPVHHNYVGIGMQRIFINGHKESYIRYWQNAENAFKDHVYLYVRGENEQTPEATLVKYENGDEFDVGNVRNTEYLDRNQAYFATPIVLGCGDIVFPIGIPIATCCQILGVDVLEIFPSCPQIIHGIIVLRGTWNKQTNRYDLQFSRPVVISDLKSSRGIDEPTITELKSGRLVVAFRGSNVTSEAWHTRIEPGTPGFKWYTYSDDGGRTFTEPVPWHFDNGEVIYSSATISTFIKSEKNDKTYWIGNITGPNVRGNYPRFPLQIAEVDETWGTLIKSSLTVIDTVREGESELLQLSNFYTIQDRESGLIEMYLAKIGQYSKDKHCWRAQTWKYCIDVGE